MVRCTYLDLVHLRVIRMLVGRFGTITLRRPKSLRIQFERVRGKAEKNFDIPFQLPLRRMLIRQPATVHMPFAE